MPPTASHTAIHDSHAHNEHHPYYDHHFQHVRAGALRQRIFSMLDRGDTSAVGKCLTALSVAMILLSFALMVAQSFDAVCPPPTAVASDNQLNATNATTTYAYPDGGCPNAPYLSYVSSACVYWFTVELLARFVVHPDKCHFVQQPSA